MAANSKGRVIAGSFGKRIANQIWTGSSRDPFPSLQPLASRRGAHVSSYDKNLDDQVRPSVVPDDVIEAKSDKYWSPHPETGVFGPTADHDGAAVTYGGDNGVRSSTAAGNGSVLDQTAWFRPLEDVEKPRPHS